MQSKSVTPNTSPGIELISISMVNTSNGPVRTYDNCVVSSSIENLYLDAGTADVNFVFGSSGEDGERVPAHKNLLSITSDVFRAMFYSEWKVSGDIHMNAGYKEYLHTAPAFKEFLQYFYLKSVTLTAGNVAEVMGLGHRYNVANCFNACLEFISDSLTIDNVCIGYALAILYEQTELKMRCERMITLNTSAVFHSTSFLASGRDVLANILHLSVLSCTETEVFMACIDWIKATAKQDELSKEIVRAKLHDLFYEIRFTSMTMKEFCLLNICYGHLFTFEEYKYIVQKITLPKLITPLGSPMFNNSLREPQWIGSNVLNCYRPIEISDENAKDKEMLSMCFVEDESGDDDTDGSDDKMSCDESSEEPFATGHSPVKDVETTTFSTNKAILLGKFVCSWVSIKESNGNLRIFEPRNIARTNTLVTFTSALQPMKDTVITLPKPVLIRTGRNYEIRMQQSPDSHCFAHRQLKTKVLIGHETIIRFHDDRLCRNKPIGLIQELLFNQF